MKIDIKKVKENAKLPTRGSAFAAGYDLYACVDEDVIHIPPHSTKMIGTGIAANFPVGYFGGVAARSGLACKHGLAPANKLGIIDSDYTGEIIVALHNDMGVEKVINNGDRIAQLVVIPFLEVEWNEVEELDATDRGSGGFGSTGS